MPIQYVDVTMTAATNLLTAGDVIAATQVVSNAAAAINEPVLLQSVTVIDVDDQKAILSAVFLDSDVVFGVEEAAPSITDANALKLQGLVAFAVADYVDVGGASIATAKNVGLVLKPALGTRDVYMALYTPATSTPTYAGGAITVRLGFMSMKSGE
jgi:hypothetical protein